MPGPRRLVECVLLERGSSSCPSYVNPGVPWWLVCRNRMVMASSHAHRLGAWFGWVGGSLQPTLDAPSSAVSEATIIESGAWISRRRVPSHSPPSSCPALHPTTPSPRFHARFTRTTPCKPPLNREPRTSPRLSQASSRECPPTSATPCHPAPWRGQQARDWPPRRVPQGGFLPPCMEETPVCRCPR